MQDDWWSGRADRGGLAAKIAEDLRVRLQAPAQEPDAWVSALLATAASFGFLGLAVWMPGEDGRLHCRHFAATLPVELFEEQTRSASLAPGEGMPGRTWLHGTPEWIPNVIKDDNFPRLRGAIRDLIRAVVAFPILANDAPVAVVEMYSRRILEADAETTALLQALGRTLSEFAPGVASSGAQRRP